MLTPRKEMTDMMESFNKLMGETLVARYAELDTPTEEPRFWLVYYNHEDREGCSVFYSYLTSANCREEAILKAATKHNLDPEDLDAVPKDLI